MATKNLKQTADELMQKPGKIRGEAFLNRLAYIRSLKGEAGVEAVFKKLKDLVYPLIEEKKIKSLEWYSDAQGILIILAARELFGWGDQEVFEMGRHSPSISLLVKMLMKYFVSAKKTFQASPGNWAKHHDIGSIEDIKYNEQENTMSFKLKNYDMHPIMCIYLRGYFTAFAGFIIKSDKIEISEIKCLYQGDDYHQFKVVWE